jgi:hypothetical protein
MVENKFQLEAEPYICFPKEFSAATLQMSYGKKLFPYILLHALHVTNLEAVTLTKFHILCHTSTFLPRLTTHPTPWIKARSQKLTVAQSVKKFPTFPGTG